jgi:hypothetical protein
MSGRWQSPFPQPPGLRHIEDFGAVPIYLGADQDQANPSLRTANTSAINAAFEWVLDQPNGAELEVGPGIYLTNGFTGIDVAADLNVNLIMRGLSEWSSIRSNNLSESTLGFRTSAGNLRGIEVHNLVLRGGREGLSLRQCCYNTFNRVWLWGSRDAGVVSEVGASNNFHRCRFDEGAQGTGSGTTADALVFTSCEDTLSDCTFGEYSGGAIFNGGANSLDNCSFRDTFTQRAQWYSNVDGSLINQAANLLPMKAGIILWQGSLSLNNCHGKAAHRLISAFRAYELSINGAQIATDTDRDFEGFIDVRTGGGTKLALKISGSQFIWKGGKSGFFVADPDNALEHAMIDAQLVVYAGSTMTALSSSAPALLNPGSEDNLVVTKTFPR